MSLRRKHKDTVLEQRGKELKEASRVLSLTKAALIMVGDMTAVTIAAFWPHPYYHAFCEHRNRSFRSTMVRLQQQGLVKKGNDSSGFFTLTSEGEKERTRALRRIHIESRKSNEPWDGKWRILTFDIPEKYKKYREFLRAELIDYGFMQLHKSVWVTPFHSAEDLKTTIEDLGMTRWVKLLVADALFDDSNLKRKFHLDEA